MRKLAPTKKIKAETAPQKKPGKAGPVELSTADMKKVSGGLPRGGWGTASTEKK